jgi:hypothetical protein
VPYGILGVFNTILYEKEFQNPQIFQQTIILFPEQSTEHFKNKLSGNYYGIWEYCPIFAILCCIWTTKKYLIQTLKNSLNG